MAKGDPITVDVSEASERAVIARINKLLVNTRREGPALVKRLARGAANSAAKLTIPNKGRNTPLTGGKSSVRRPTTADKLRPIVNTKDAFRGNFYLVNSVRVRKGRRKKRGSSRKGFTASGESKVVRGANGELVIYTTKKISQKDSRLTKISKAIKVWDKKKRSWKYIPTTAKGKYDRKSAWGKIPNFFTAKQAWLFSAARISRTLQKLNPKARNFGQMVDNLKNLDNPSVTMRNVSKYAGKSNGRSVPRRAIMLAMRGLVKELEKTKKKIVRK